MKHHDVAIIGQGQDFDLYISVVRKYIDDGYLRTEEIVLSSCTDVTVKIVTYCHKNVDFCWKYVTGTNKIRVSVDGSLEVGDYGIEIKGKFASGRNWRFFAPPGEVFQIVNPTRCANGLYHECMRGVDYVACIGVSAVGGETLVAMQELTEQAAEIVNEGKALVEGISNFAATYDDGYLTLNWPNL